MPLDLDIRNVLNVNPHPDKAFNCVGYAPSKRRRCLNPINVRDRDSADRLLDQMDQSESASEITKDLKLLACMLLCNRNHQSQVDMVYNKWQRLVAEKYLRLKQEEEREQERRKQLKLKNELAKIKSIATQVRNKLEEEESDAIEQTKPVPLKTFVSSSRANIDDPFETRTSSSARPNLFTQHSPLNNAQNIGILPGDFTVTQSNELSVREWKEVALPSDLPSPPTHDPFWPPKAATIAIATQHKTRHTTENDLETNPLSKFAFAFGSRSGNGDPSFQFETPAKVKTTQVEAPSSTGSARAPVFSEFSFGTWTPSIVSLPETKKPAEEPKRIPLQEKATKAMNTALSNKSELSTFEFGSREKKLSSAFEFEVPIKLQQPPKIKDSTPPVLQLKVIPPEEDDLKTSSTSTHPPKQSEESDLLPHTQDGPPPTSNETIDILLPTERPTTPPRNEDLFGYANITPNSTRYTTYLPARQQCGLVTPPETPEMLARALSKRMNDSGYFRGERPREVGSPVSMIPRKPLLVLPPMRFDDEKEQRQQARAACGKRAGQGLGDCRCGEGGVDAEVQTGCLVRLGFRRLQEKVKGKLKATRRSISRRNDSGSPS